MSAAAIDDGLTASVDDIKVGQRTRNDLGNIGALAESITEVGLLHPIVVTPDMGLVAGQRRLVACRQLGWEEVPIRVIRSLTTAVSVLRAEHDENTCRKDFAPSEAVELGIRLEELERPAAEQRRAEGNRKGGTLAAPGRPKKVDGDSPSTLSDGPQGPVRNIVGPAVGMTPTRYAHAKTVVAATEDPNPDVAEVAKVAQQEMDADGKVETAYRKVEKARDEAGLPPMRLRKAPTTPPGKRSAVAQQERRIRIREMATSGHSRRQIAAALDLNPDTVKVIADELGVTINADVVMGRTRHIDPNRVMREMVISLEAEPITLDLIKDRLHELDPDQVDYWTSSLGDSLRYLNRFHKQLKEFLRDQA